MLCKVFLAFFKKESDVTDELAVCDGQSVKMFADMIMKSLCDEDFVSGMILKTILCFIFFMGLFTFFRFADNIGNCPLVNKYVQCKKRCYRVCSKIFIYECDRQ